MNAKFLAILSGLVLSSACVEPDPSLERPKPSFDNPSDLKESEDPEETDNKGSAANNPEPEEPEPEEPEPEEPEPTPTAVVLINEIAAVHPTGCDMIELRVMASGSIGGFRLTERRETIFVFPDLEVAQDDLIIVHAGTRSEFCNPDDSSSESLSKDEFPRAEYSTNYDNAWDFYIGRDGFAATNNVFALFDASNTPIDAVFSASAYTCDFSESIASGTRSQAVSMIEAGEWLAADGQPLSTNVTWETFCDSATGGLENAEGKSIQRSSDVDTNSVQDWTSSRTASFGELNDGQSPL